MRLLTAREVAEILAVPRYRVYELARQGVLPSVRLGFQVRVEEGALREFVARGGQGLPRRDPQEEERRAVGA